MLTDLGAGLPGSPGWFRPPSTIRASSLERRASLFSGVCTSCSPSTCGPPEGWIYQNGTLTQLPALGSDVYTFADDINNEGTVSGGSAGYTTEEAVLWSNDLSIKNLGVGILGSQSSAEAVSISNSARSLASRTMQPMKSQRPLTARGAHRLRVVRAQKAFSMP